MTTKQIAIELVQKLPEEVSLKEIAREIEFVAGIEEGLAEFDRGETVTSEQLLSEVSQWAMNTK
jgi:predicted transcriptional regulator